MEDTDIKKLLITMSKLRVIPVEVTKKVLKEFYEIISESESYIFSDKSISKETIIEAVGEERARRILTYSQLESSKYRTLESLEKVEAQSLSDFLLNEHPQIISVVLAHLDPEKKGEVLKRLPEVLQTEVILRLSHLNHVDPELVSELDQILKKELSSVDTNEIMTLGGAQAVADMLNTMDRDTENLIMSRVQKRDPMLSTEIQKHMFVFEDLIKISDQGIQILLREVSNNKLLLALKTTSGEVKKKIFKNISQRAENLLREDLEHMGPSRLLDVETAQEEIINIARKLEMSGQIFISRGGLKNALV